MKTPDMDSVSKCGPMEQSMRATGETMWLQREESSTMLTGMSMTVGNWENEKANGYGALRRKKEDLARAQSIIEASVSKRTTNYDK